jgi:hexosaminidase
VLEQYDSAAQLWIARADKVHSAQRQWLDSKTLPSAADLGIPPAANAPAFDGAGAAQTPAAAQ